MDYSLTVFKHQCYNARNMSMIVSETCMVTGEVNGHERI